MSDIGITVFGNQLATTIRGVARHRVAAVIATLVLLPWVAPYEALSINILLFGLYAVGFNLVYGYTGLLSFGHAAFFGVGAYACGIVVATFGVNWLLAIALGTIVPLSQLGKALAACKKHKAKVVIAKPPVDLHQSSLRATLLKWA